MKNTIRINPLLLTAAGTLIMSIGFITKPFVSLNEASVDFAKGLGVALVISSLLIAYRYKRRK